MIITKKKLGIDFIRDEKISQGMYHLVSEILVKHIDGSYLLMQRDLNKQGYPGKFEASAGGSVLKGETAYDAAVRELSEETDISSILSLEFMRHYTSSHTLYYGFLCLTDCDKTSIQLQEDETISYCWCKEEDFIDFLNSQEAIPLQKIRLEPYLCSL